MRRIKLREIAEAIGIAAIVASLVFVGLQLKQDRLVALAETHQSSLQSAVEINAAMAEHAEVWAKARKSSDLTDAETVVMNQLIDMWRVRAFFETRSGQAINEGRWRGPVERFAIVLHENATAKKLYLERVQRDERFLGEMNAGDQMPTASSRSSRSPGRAGGARRLDTLYDYRSLPAESRQLSARLLGGRF